MCPCQLAAKRDADARRPTASARGYNGAWQKARKGFLQSHPHCVMCGEVATVVDHIQPHRNDIRLFWDKSNWQSLCSFHHNSFKQRLEKQSPDRAGPRKG
jgi:5-methylcytosine-specific restriction endonuclease McrA